MHILQIRRSRSAIAIACLLCLSSALLSLLFSCYVEPVNAIKLNLVSDIHYDPFYGTEQGFKCKTATSPKFGAANCDSPESLIDSLFTDLQEQNSTQTLFGGDWQRHRYSSDMQCDIVFDKLSNILVNTTNGKANTTTITIGNNDMVPNYHFDFNNASQPLMECHVEAMQKNGLLKDDDKQTENATVMKKFGYYAHEVDNVRIISIHSLLWTHLLTPPVADNEQDPAGQMKFLRDQLTEARQSNTPVIILGHIPPTLDVYNVIHRGNFLSEDVDMYWKPTFQAAYFNLIAEFKDTVKMQVFGHTHTFALVALPFTGSPLVVVGAVTPIYNTSPTYLIATLTDDAEPIMLRRRYLGNDEKWHDGYDVTGALGLKRGLSNVTEIQNNIREMMSNDVSWTNYQALISKVEDNEYLKLESTCNTFCRAVTVCAMINDTYNGIKECVNELTAPVNDNVDANVKGSIITIVLILGLVFAVVAILLLRNIIPKIKAGDFSFSKIDFDFRAQLFNLPPRNKSTGADVTDNYINSNMESDERVARKYMNGEGGDRNKAIV